MKNINIEIWSDVVCPFCYLGKRKLEKAMEAVGLNENVEIIWRSFQLDPDFPEQKGAGGQCGGRACSRPDKAVQISGKCG